MLVPTLSMTHKPSRRGYQASRWHHTPGSGSADKGWEFLDVRSPHSQANDATRSFWSQRIDKYSAGGDRRSGMWSLRKMVASMGARSTPLRMSCFHALYCAGVTIPFVTLHQSGDAELFGAQLVEHLCTHANAMTGCTSFLATALFLMLSFRINRATARWWEGRRLFGDLLGEVRGLLQALRVYVKPMDTTQDISRMVFCYSRAVEFHLRSVDQQQLRVLLTPLLPPQHLEPCLSAPHPPHYIAEQISQQLSRAFDTGQIKGIRALVALHEIVQRILVLTQGLVRIQKTPEPWSYQKHMRFTTLLWLGILPLALLPSLQVATPGLSTAIAFVVFKLDDVAVELQNPFGYDKSDLHICLLNDELQQELRHMAATFSPPPAPALHVDQATVDREADTKGLSHSL